MLDSSARRGASLTVATRTEGAMTAGLPARAAMREKMPLISTAICSLDMLLMSTLAAVTGDAAAGEAATRSGAALCTLGTGCMRSAEAAAG